MSRYRLHWLQLGGGEEERGEAAREGQQEGQCGVQRGRERRTGHTALRREKRGHSRAPPNCFPKDIFLSSTPQA